jgi:sugar O-acyltransferase (sialic acid O-acetyltransferase NeuD family)
MKKLLIFPFNGNALEALDCIGDKFEIIGFVDDTLEKQGLSDQGIPVFSRAAFDQFPEAFVLAVPGSPSSYRFRHAVIDSLGISESRYATVIHSGAFISKGARVGFNTLIMAGVVVNNSAVIGNHVCILPNSVVHHDSTVEDYALIGSGVIVAGNTQIGRNCYIGSGSNIKNNLKVGKESLVGMGSNVIHSVPSFATVAGNPARLLKA